MKIVFLIGSPYISGGTYVIFQHVLALMSAGHEVSSIPMEEATPERIEWYPQAKQFCWTTFDEAQTQQYDVAVATYWKTAYKLYRVKARKYAYFVQSIESRFYNMAEKPIRQLVEATYMLPVHIITEATWIKDYLNDRYDREAYLVRNGIRKDIYTSDGESFADREEGKLRVLIEGNVKAPFKNIPKTVKLCRKSEADEIWLMTPSALKRYRGVDRVFSNVPIIETPKVYRSCDVLVKLSYVEGMFGPPLEMFHCGGTSVTYDVTGYDEYIKDGENAIVIPTNCEAEVVEAINRLKRNPQELNCLKERAQLTAQRWPDWNTASAEFEQALLDIVSKPEENVAKQLKIQSEFQNESYKIAEDYRRRCAFGIRSLWFNLKQHIKLKHPALFYKVKKIVRGYTGSL